MSCGIYKIENQINHKIYIGQSVEIERRFSKHKEAVDDFAIHRALRKYGVENFSFDIVEECPQNELDEKEQYWIDYYDSMVPNGYNMVPGGQMGADYARFKPVNQYDLSGNFIQQFPSIREAERQTGTNDSNIVSCCKGIRNYAGESQWRYPDSELPLQHFEKVEKVKSKEKIIQQIDPNTQEVIAEYPSASEAFRQTGINIGNIGSCCEGKRKTAGGFQWKKIVIENKITKIINKKEQK